MMVDNWTVKIQCSRGVCELRLVIQLDNQSEIVEEVGWLRDVRK